MGHSDTDVIMPSYIRNEIVNKPKTDMSPACITDKSPTYNENNFDSMFNNRESEDASQI